MAGGDGLSAEERAELEQLRAEKAAREQRQRESAERAELERLRAERARGQAEAAEDARIAQRRAEGKKLMEPDEDDDDIRMPKGQKIVLAAIFLIALAVVLMTFFGG